MPLTGQCAATQLHRATPAQGAAPPPSDITTYAIRLHPAGHSPPVGLRLEFAVGDGYINKASNGFSICVMAQCWSGWEARACLDTRTLRSSLGYTQAF